MSFKEDKISLLGLEMKNLFLKQNKKINGLESKMDVGFANIRAEFQVEIRNQTKWFISSIFIAAGMAITLVKIL